MHYLMELYTPKPAWADVDAARRQAFFRGIGAGLAALPAGAVTPLAMAVADPGKPGAAGHAFLALWSCADEAALDALLAGIRASGWYEYFDTVSTCGSAQTFEEHLASLAAA